MTDTTPTNNKNNSINNQPGGKMMQDDEVAVVVVSWLVLLCVVLLVSFYLSSCTFLTLYFWSIAFVRLMGFATMFTKLGASGWLYHGDGWGLARQWFFSSERFPGTARGHNDCLTETDTIFFCGRLQWFLLAGSGDKAALFGRRSE